MVGFIQKIKNGKYFEEKKRFLLFVFFLFLILFFSFYLLKIAYARYETSTKINANIDKALYILGEEKLSFNIDSSGIIPSTNSYIYKFSISNFNESRQSDVDITYDLSIITTTNLPITLSLYRNELADSIDAVNIFNGSVEKNDNDGAWYRVYSTVAQTMNYNEKKTDVYTLVIDFPSVYGNDTTYADYIENIEVKIDSKQII